MQLFKDKDFIITLVMFKILSQICLKLLAFFPNADNSQATNSQIATDILIADIRGQRQNLPQGVKDCITRNVFTDRN